MMPSRPHTVLPDRSLHRSHNFLPNTIRIHDWSYWLDPTPFSPHLWLLIGHSEQTMVNHPTPNGRILPLPHNHICATCVTTEPLFGCLPAPSIFL